MCVDTIGRVLRMCQLTDVAASFDLQITLLKIENVCFNSALKPHFPNPLFVSSPLPSSANALLTFTHAQ
uniref:Uncharacterized protein n=1 Tax=Ascaris lumbricoides TaxID=6252 RepID=A0A0M3IEK1_ASCLU